MNRRALLSTLAILPSVGVAGCLGRRAATDSDSVSLPDPVSELEFEITDTGFDPRDDPVISVTEGPSEATVEGAIWVGSENCTEATLTDVSFDGTDDSIALRVGPGKSDEHPDTRLLGGSCDEAMSADGYQIEISVEDNVRAITVTERDAEGNSRTAQSKYHVIYG